MSCQERELVEHLISSYSVSWGKRRILHIFGPEKQGLVLWSSFFSDLKALAGTAVVEEVLLACLFTKLVVRSARVLCWRLHVWSLVVSAFDVPRPSLLRSWQALGCSNTPLLRIFSTRWSILFNGELLTLMVLVVTDLLVATWLASLILTFLLAVRET